MYRGSREDPGFQARLPTYQQHRYPPSLRLICNMRHRHGRCLMTWACPSSGPEAVLTSLCGPVAQGWVHAGQLLSQALGAHTQPLPPALESSHLLLQCETQVVAGRLDLVLGLQVGHGICVDAVNGHHKVTRAELGLGGLAARCDLRG